MCLTFFSYDKFSYDEGGTRAALTNLWPPPSPSARTLIVSCVLELIKCVLLLAKFSLLAAWNFQGGIIPLYYYYWNNPPLEIPGGKQARKSLNCSYTIFM
jgi:hypothetical protein